MTVKRILSMISAGLTAAAMCLTTRPAPASALTNDTPGIESGTVYYIKNIDNGKYLDVKNGGDANGNDVWTYSYNASAAQKWRVVRNSDGSYTLYSVLSTGNRVLDVTGTNVDIWSYNSSYNCQKFKITRYNWLLQSGTYSISTNTEVYNFLEYDPETESVKTTKSPDPMRRLWSFEPVEKHDADFYSFYYQNGTFLGLPTYYDTRGAASTFMQKCENMGYCPYHFTNSSAPTAYEYLKSNDSIWVFRGHGLVTNDENENPEATIVFRNENGRYNGYLTANYAIEHCSQDKAIDSLSSNALAKAQCVIYMGCSTGVSYNGYNLVTSTYNKGAHFALGTTQTILTGTGDKWTKKFFEKADTGATIRECYHHANYYHDIGALYYEGDIYAKLK